MTCVNSCLCLTGRLSFLNAGWTVSSTVCHLSNWEMPEWYFHQWNDALPAFPKKCIHGTESICTLKTPQSQRILYAVCCLLLGACQTSKAIQNEYRLYCEALSIACYGVCYCVFVTQTAQAHQQVVEKQVSATLAHLTEPGNSHCITPSLSYFQFACIKSCLVNLLTDAFCWSYLLLTQLYRCLN